MKLKILCALALSFVIFFGCQNQPANQTTSSAPVVRAPDVNADSRSKQELIFLNRVKAESDYDVTSNAVKKDAHITAFNKYALDSLKKMNGWEMIVTEVNDNEFDANSTAKVIFGGTPVYNLKLVAPIKIDKKADTIAIDNRVDFTVTIPKNPKSEMLKTQLNIIKNLSRGDTVIVSGGLTHLDAEGKINFAAFYNDMATWDIDLLALDIQKKPGGHVSKSLSQFHQLHFSWLPLRQASIVLMLLRHNINRVKEESSN